jgi:hypothetical protein
MSPGKWQMPRKLANSSISSRDHDFFFRIHNWFDVGTIKIDFDLEATRKRPPFTVHLEYDIRNKAITPLAVNLLFSSRQCMYAYKVCAPVRGDMVLDGRHTIFNPATTSGLFRDYKGYYPYQTYLNSCNAQFFDKENRRFGFSITENQARETYKNNENALWIDGTLNPLPPVRITMSAGDNSDWVIQDMEGMVDLVFTPQEPVKSRFDFILAYSEYDFPLGLYNGMLVSSTGEHIPVHNQLGFGEKIHLRI